MSVDGFCVPDKAPKGSSATEAADLSVQLQSTRSFPFPCDEMMMPRRGNPYRPFPPHETWGGGADDAGPTSCNYARLESRDAYQYDVVANSDSAAAGVVAVRDLQPFDISPSILTHTLPAFKSPGTTMAASLEFPFTNAQWKELERQAKVYKYMMSSAPVPPDLLIPTTGNTTVPTASYPSMGNGLNLRFSRDLEPGRCRRTDGKKWRCSRDVAPDHKYCERHMHRGRPRSRKPVELSNKKTHRSHTRGLLSSSSPNMPFDPSTTDASASQLVGTFPTQFYQNQVSEFLDKSGEKATTFVSLASATSYDEPRSVDWMINGEPIPIISPDQQWHLQHTKTGVTTERCFSNIKSVLSQSYGHDHLNVHPYANLTAGEDQQSNDCPSLRSVDVFASEKPRESVERSFIDAWSSGVADDHNLDSGTKAPVSSNEKLPLSPLSLSMGSNNIVYDEAATETDHNNVLEEQLHPGCLASVAWRASTPGGPLAEVLRPSKVTAEASSDISSAMGRNGESCCSPAWAVSSPSGVLQRNLASFSDSSGSNSPVLGGTGQNLRLAYCG